MLMGQVVLTLSMISMFDFILIYAFKIAVVIAFLREKSLEKFKKHFLEKICKRLLTPGIKPETFWLLKWYLKPHGHVGYC